MTDEASPAADAPALTPQTPPTVPPENAAPETKPKKSPVLMIALLAVVVLLVSGSAVWYFGKSNTQPVPEEKPVSMAAPTPAPLFLDITSPNTETTAVNGEILVSGRTLPNTTVFIVTDNDDTGMTSDAQGNFEATVVVGTNGGLLQVTAYGSNGDEQSKTFDIKAQ